MVWSLIRICRQAMRIGRKKTLAEQCGEGLSVV